MTRPRAGEFFLAALRLLFVTIFALAGVVSERPEIADQTYADGMSSHARPMQTAVLSKKDNVRTLASADRRSGPKARWDGSSDALPSQPFLPRRSLTSGTLLAAVVPDRLADCGAAAFRARAPPHLTA